MDETLGSVGATWSPPSPQPTIRITLAINIPEYSAVRRNSVTGQVEITEVTQADLISLRDSLNEQIAQIEQGSMVDDGWEVL